jgi:HTH-type transcriptional regulator / antitoxin HigA
MKLMKVAPIRTERDYEAALAEIEGLMDAEADTPEGDRLDVLVTLVEAYEARHWEIDPPDPIDAINLRLEQRGLSRRFLLRIFGTSGRVSEIMNRKRPLSVEMMRRLHHELDIPAGSFLRRPKRARGFRGTPKRRRKTA